MDKRSASQKGGLLLDETQVHHIQKQLNGVNVSLSDLRERFARIESSLNHKHTEAKRVEQILDQLELLLYGKGAEDSSHESLVSRVKRLEDFKRIIKTTIMSLWALVLALFTNLIHNFFGGK